MGGHGTNPYTWALANTAKNTVRMGTYIYEFISEVPLPPVSIFYSVKQIVQGPVTDGRIGREGGRLG